MQACACNWKSSELYLHIMRNTVWISAVNHNRKHLWNWLRMYFVYAPAAPEMICIKPAAEPLWVRTVSVNLVAFDSCSERRHCICIHHRFKMASCRSRWRGQRWEDWISLPITAAWPPGSAVQKHLITKTNYPSGKCITVTTQGLAQED